MCSPNIMCMEDMMQNHLILMRGLPGSGKSTQAKEIRQSYENKGYKVCLYSTDEFWGEPYTFIASRIGEAHLWNQVRAIKSMISARHNEGVVIIIDNTNTTTTEMLHYIEPALSLCFQIEICEPVTLWRFDPKECFHRTIHGVPLATIERMLSRYEMNVTLEQCISLIERGSDD